MDHAAPSEATSDPEIPWHLASTLSERLSWGSAPSEIDAARGARRLEMWLELQAFSDGEDALGEWLATAGLDREGFTALLGETEASLRARRGEEPEWYRTFRRWWGAFHDSEAHRLHGDLQLLEWARPILEGAIDELASALAGLAVERTDPVFADERIAERFLETVPLSYLHSLMQRTAVLELNVFRVEQRLTGDDPAARFKDFCRQLATDEVALPLWREYCALARLVVTQLRYWIDTQVELFTALAEDLDLIRAEIPGMADARRLESISLGEGDRHRRGRSVGILRFDRGTLVHKPRSLAMDTAYNGLVDWLNDRGLRHDLSTVATVDRGEHGWARYLESEQPVDEEGARRFSWRLGASAAVLYALHATDFHFENIMASGEHPLLVDLETLLHADKTEAVVKVNGSADVTALALANSVHSTGLLPNPIIMRDEDGSHAMDMSGARGRGGQMTPMRVPAWDGDETDQMRIVKRRMELDGESNQAVGEDGTPYDIARNRDAVAAGFSETYALLQRHADALVAPGGPLDAFAHLQTRHIARPTHAYGTILLESTHPDFLRDGLDRDRSLARLRRGHDERPERTAMIDSEIAELTGGDIPVFTIETSTGALHCGSRPQPIGQRSEPLTVVKGRIRSLNEQDRLRQHWIVDASLAATTMVGTEARWPDWSQPLPDDPVGRGDLEAQALSVAERIRSLLIRGEDSMGWLGLDLVDERHWILAPTPLGLYNGIGGITFALDAVAAATGDAAVAEDAAMLHDYIARRSRMMVEAFDDPVTGPPSIELAPVGAFNESAGTAYVLAHAAVRHGRDDYAEAAVRLLPIIDRVVDEDVSFDIVSGCAGLILAMESVEAAAPGRGALELAHRAARRLIEGRKDFEHGWGWVSPVNDGAALNGYSHGTAGIAAAFARLNALDPREEYRTAVARALAYENATFDPERGLWTDLRAVSRGTDAVMNAWCHGAPGIGLARRTILDTEGHGADPAALRADLDTAAGVLYRAGWHTDPVTGTGNHSLCHGDMGNLLMLDAIATAPEVRERLPRLWRALLTDGSANGWLCGVPHGVETPGLMTGLAGIAWGLARKADPAHVPDLLRLEPPRGGARRG